MASGLLADPPASLAIRRSERAPFEARLLGRWGRALDLFELTTDHALQTSVWVRQNLCDQDPSPARSEALIRLHARALSIAQEVHVLLKSGYATAAYARWRTLYEVQIVFDTLAAGDNSLSDRYLRLWFGVGGRRCLKWHGPGSDQAQTNSRSSRLSGNRTPSRRTPISSSPPRASTALRRRLSDMSSARSSFDTAG
jgi:Family of unknown function (DUF5677)